MIGNAIKQTSTTAGTGNLTLLAVTGCAKFSDAFAVNQPFSYTLLDSGGLFLEAGIGYLSNSTTLVRARVTATLASGTYTDESASALSLTGTTTVICAPHAAAMPGMIPTVDAVSASMNRYLGPSQRNANTSSVGAAALRCSYSPFKLEVGAPIGALILNVTTAGAGGTVARLGVYACKADGYIGDRLLTTGDIATDSTGVKSGSVTPTFLSPGWYYTASVFSGNPTVSAWASALAGLSAATPFGWGNSTTPVEFRHETLASAVLPGAASSSTTAVNVGVAHFPMVLMGVA